ncbi:S-layer homology domain-containing protein [Aedoeadaptatus urinae]|uniref:S-layer homology domain-containing protein n=1 Tax=Aedoeadaptatus urinae TaxID=1871017 RepID=UPI00097DEF28|nr:S-layer homology domain-containing protein [Peptoniphilus urinae]
MGTPTYHLDEANQTITTLDGAHKYKYDFTYDVINGGKLTMTEILPVTFDANGGKFATITEPAAEQKIVKEVEYDGTLTDKAENPTKDRETFKGWGIKDEASGTLTPVKDADYQSIKAAKTFYAIWDNNDIEAKEIEVKESFKDGTGYVNDFIPTLETLKGQVKIKDANGDPQPLTNDDKLQILDDEGNPIADADLKDKLYEKLKEDDATEDSRNVTLKAKVTRADGIIQTVDIPIKVVKNIYEAKTNGEKPSYVPDGYVKVTVDPTTKAEKPQKYFYYVNPAAKVVIPGEDPTGTGDNQFAKWLIKGTETEYKLADKPRHQFDEETTIEAQYVSNVIPGNPDGSKPDTVPNNYVKVSFVLSPEKGGKIADDAITVYYVNPKKEVTIPQPKTIADIGYEFEKWDPDTTTAKKYDTETTIKGSFKGLKNIIPATNDDGTSNNKPDGYVTVTFTDGMQGKVHGKITSGKTVYYVNPNANKQLKHLVNESYNLANRPIVTPDVGYKFTGWLQGKEYRIVKDVTVPAEYEAIADVIPKTKDDGSENEKPDGYVTVKLIPTDKATDETKADTIYYVNPTKEVTIPSKDPVGREITDKNGNTYTYMFKNWTVSKGTIHLSWDKPETGDTEIKGTFAEETEITAKYNIKAEKLVNGPKAKENPITEIDKLPDPKDLIKNPYDPTNPDNKDNLPKGTTFTYTPDGTPNVSKSGKPTAKVEVKYPNGKTVVVEVPITVVDNVVPQKGDDKPNVPADYVKVTFEIEGEGGKIADKEITVYYVNPAKAVTIPQPKTVADTGYTFKEWDKDTTKDATYTVDTIVKGSFENLKDVIPKTNDDGSENEKPDGYVTVKLIPTDKATDETKADTIYYVNPTKEVTIPSKDPVGREITDKNGNTYTYMFKNWTVSKGTIHLSWDKPETGDTEIKGTFAEETEITAKYNIKAEKLVNGPKAKENPITEIDKLPDPKDLIKNPYDPTNPDNKDNLPKGTTFTYTPDGTPDVSKSGKPTAKVEVKYPNGKTVVVEVPITVVDNVVPQKGDDKPNVPADYVKVTFEIEGEGGKIADKEITVYYVNPAKEVTIPQPKTVADTGYTFKEWDKDTKTPAKYSGETTIKGNFTKGKDIIPSTDDQGKPNDKPEGYVTLTFVKGEHGKEIIGQAVYYVNPKADPAKTLGDESIVKPEVKAETGYKFTGWDTKDDFELKADKTVKAQYEPIADVVPKDNPQGGENEKPDGYITVTFKTTEKGGNVEKVVYINPNKAVKLKGYAPEVKPITGYDFVGWDRAVNEKVQYTEETVITAKFNEKGDVIPQEKTDGSDRPAGYLTVTFAKGEHGELSGKTVYYVNPNKEVTVPAPTVIPATGYEHKGWDKALTQTFAEDTTITAEYSKRPFEPTIITDTVITKIGKLPTEEDYKNKIHVPGEDFKVTKILKEPDVSKSGTSEAEVEIEFANGVRKTVRVSVYVESGTKIIEKPVPGDCNNSCDQPNKPNQPNIGMDALNTRDHYQYLIGYPDGNFAPNKGMTRAEVATMFTRLLRERPVKGQRYYTGFSDIQAGDWYANTVGYAVQVGIVSGYPDGSFKPNKPITRAEFAAIASRFDALAQGNNIAFSDLAPSHWGYAAIRSAASKGWISGYPDNTFRPEKAISRAEVTSITNRMLNRYADLYWIDAHRAEVIRFGDVKRSDWYFEPIMEATMGHDFIRDRDMKTEHWTGLNGKSFI